MKLHHVSLRVKNLEELKDFFVKELRGKVRHIFSNNFGEAYGYFINLKDSGMIEIFKDDSGKINRGSIDHFALEVEDIDKYNKLVSQKYKCTPIRRGKTDKVLQFEVELTENIKIEFLEIDELASYSEDE